MTIPKSIFFVFVMIVCVCGAGAGAQDTPAPAATGALLPNDVHPTLITLHVKKGTIAATIAEISKRSGIDITVAGQPDVRVSIDVDQKPFWEVLYALCDQARATVQPTFWTGPRLQVNVGFGGAPSHRVVAGPLVATFTRIEHLNQLTAPTSTQDYCDVQASVMWEPRLALAYLEKRSIPTSAVDEDGLSLIPDPAVHDPRTWDAAMYESPDAQNNFGTNFQHSICLKVPMQAGRRIAHMTGQIRVWVVDKTEKVTIPDLAVAKKKNPQIKVPNSLTQIQLSNIYAQDQNVQLQMLISRASNESADAWEQRRHLLTRIRADVFDPAGKPWSETAVGQQYGDQNPAQIYLQIQRSEGLKTSPKKAVLEIPVSVVEVDIPYDLHDLPLP